MLCWCCCCCCILFCGDDTMMTTIIDPISHFIFMTIPKKLSFEKIRPRLVMCAFEFKRSRDLERGMFFLLRGEVLKAKKYF